MNVSRRSRVRIAVRRPIIRATATLALSMLVALGLVGSFLVLNPAISPWTGPPQPGYGANRSMSGHHTFVRTPAGVRLGGRFSDLPVEVEHSGVALGTAE